MTVEEARADLMLAQADISYRPKDDTIDMAIEVLENQKTGHWIRITNGAMKEKYICSECGRQIEDYGVENLLPIKYPYCHCGVKMEGNKE